MDNTTEERGKLQNFQRMRRLVLALIIAALVIALLFVRSAWGEEGHEFVEAIGIGTIAAGILGRMWCTLYIGGSKAYAIVTAGPYSISRNPLYLFSSIAAFGVGAQTGSLIVAFVFLIGCALAFHVVILREERFLLPAFGEPYRAYLSAVPRFVPRTLRVVNEDSLVVQPARLYRTLIDGMVFFVAMPALEIVEWLQSSGVLPVVLRLY